MSKIKFHILDYAAMVGFIAYAASTASTPMSFSMMARDFGLSFADGGFLELFRTLGILALLLLSGFAANRWGKTLVLGVSALALCAGLWGSAISPVFFVLLLAIGFAGLGSGALEGLINPLVQELHRNDSGRYLNIINGFWSVGIVASALLIGSYLQAGGSWREVKFVIGLFAFAAGVMFLLHARRQTPGVTYTVRETVQHMVDIFRHPRMRYFFPAMFFAGGVEGAFTFWVPTYMQSHLHLSTQAGGTGLTCFAGGMVLGRLVFGHYVPQQQLRTLILASIALGALMSVAMPFTRSALVLYAVLVLTGIAIACFWPSLQSYAADRMPRVDVTMLFILLSCAGIPGFGLVSLAMGVVADVSGSLQISFLCIPVVFLLLGLTLLFDGREKLDANAL